MHAVAFLVGIIPQTLYGNIAKGNITHTGRKRNGSSASGSVGLQSIEEGGTSGWQAPRVLPCVKNSSLMLQVERCPGRIRMRQELRFTGPLCQVTMSHTASTYDASVLMDTNDDDTRDTDRQPITVGMDVGVKELAVLSNGERFPAHQQPKGNIHRLRRR